MTTPEIKTRNKSRLELVKNRKFIWLISAVLSIASLVAFTMSSINKDIGLPLKPGLDFTGGTQITFKRLCADRCNSIDTLSISRSLTSIKDKGLTNKDTILPNLSSVKIQVLDNSSSLLIRLPFLSASQSDYVIRNLYNDFGPFDESQTSIDTIGPSLGSKLLKSSLISLVVSFIGIALYINFRYDIRYSFLALLALAHDVLIVCGFFSWMGMIYGVEVDSLFAVALLTVAGYSVNNTVVVFDRIRERCKIDFNLSLSSQIDNAVNATFTRTIYTSLTTLLPLICIIIWGGSSLYWFAIALSLGVIIGGWSSIALAPTLLSLSRNRIK